MEQRRLLNTNNRDFYTAWELYEQVFPEQERRPLDFQKQIMNHPSYNFEIVELDGDFVGFILWWQFKGLKFIEHFAVLKKIRSKGFGRKILKHFMTANSDEIILEVELAKNDLCKRRIAFYQDMGFKLNTYHYEQLPMRKNGKSIEMLLMTFPDKISLPELNSFKENFRILCYDPYLA
jgi:ribosomal protein S18 acetylase RimI-like enzyme